VVRQLASQRPPTSLAEPPGTAPRDWHRYHHECSNFRDPLLRSHAPEPARQGLDQWLVSLVWRLGATGTLRAVGRSTDHPPPLQAAHGDRPLPSAGPPLHHLGGCTSNPLCGNLCPTGRRFAHTCLVSSGTKEHQGAGHSSSGRRRNGQPQTQSKPSPTSLGLESPLCAQVSADACKRNLSACKPPRNDTLEPQPLQPCSYPWRAGLHWQPTLGHTRGNLA